MGKPETLIDRPGSKDGELRNWLSVVSLALVAFGLVASEFMPIGILTLVAADLHVSTGTAGIMILTPGLVAAISAPLVVVGSGKLDRRYLVLILTGLMIVSNLVAALTPSFELMVAARVFLGIGLGGFWATGPSLAFRLVKEGSGTKATALVLSGVSAGTVLGLPVGAFVGDLAGWRWAFAGAAFVAALVFVVQLVILPKIPAIRGLGFSDLRKVFQRPMARVGLVAAILLFAGQFGGYTYVSPFFLNIAHLDPALVAVLLLVNGGAGFLGTFVAGFVIPKNRVAALVVPVAAIGVSMIVLPFAAGSVVLVSILFLLWGFVWGASPISIQTWMMAAWPEAPEAASAVLVSTIGSSIALGSFLGGRVVDSAGVSADLIFAGLLALTSGLFVLATRKVTVGAGSQAKAKEEPGTEAA